METFEFNYIAGAVAKFVRTERGVRSYKTTCIVQSKIPESVCLPVFVELNVSEFHVFVCFRVPKISLEQSKGLSDALIEELTKNLVDLANELKGEVMIYELAQTVQAFLHKHNKQPAGSFYDQMLLEKLKRDEDLQQMQQLKLNQEKQIIRDEVLKRKEIFRSETKWRRDRRSISESSPTHRSNGSSEEMGSPSTVFRSRIYPFECTEHRSSDTLYFSNVGRKIQKGCCMGKSFK